MTEELYREKVFGLLKEIEKLSCEYCGEEIKYLHMFMDDEIISINNNYWEEEVVGIDMHEWRKKNG